MNYSASRYSLNKEKKIQNKIKATGPFLYVHLVNSRKIWTSLNWMSPKIISYTLSGNKYRVILHIFRYFFTSRDGFLDSWIFAFLDVDWTHRMLVGARLADDLLQPLLNTIDLDQNGLRPSWPGLKPAPAWESPCPPWVFKYHPSTIVDQSHCQNIHLHNWYHCF